MMSKHPVRIKGYTGSLEELGRSLARLRYDKLIEVVTALQDELVLQAVADRSRGRRQLANELMRGAGSVLRALSFLEKAWHISEHFEIVGTDPDDEGPVL